MEMILKYAYLKVEHAILVLHKVLNETKTCELEHSVAVRTQETKPLQRTLRDPMLSPVVYIQSQDTT